MVCSKYSQVDRGIRTRIMNVRSIVGKIAGFVITSLVILTVIYLLPAILLGLLLFTWFEEVYLRYRFNRKWGRHGRRMLLVYSDSPNWKDYIEQNWIPRMGNLCVLLDWSQRSSKAMDKDIALQLKILKCWGGRTDFNPLVIYFPRKGKIRTIRFWQAFNDFKHGNDQSLLKAEHELFSLADALNRGD